MCVSVKGREEILCLRECVVCMRMYACVLYSTYLCVCVCVCVCRSLGQYVMCVECVREVCSVFSFRPFPGRGGEEESWRQWTQPQREGGRERGRTGGRGTEGGGRGRGGGEETRDTQKCSRESQLRSGETSSVIDI